MPSTSLIKESRLRVDAVGIALLRVELKEIYETKPETLKACNVFSDGSPVTGSEIQGQIIEFIFTCGLCLQWILSGVLLHYGQCTLACKTFAFVWALYLVVGPHAGMLQWLLYRVVAVTTDMGTELGLGMAPDIVPIFLRWLKGEPLADLKKELDLASRLMPYAMRIADWGHTCGNLAKQACYMLEDWLKIRD